MDRPELRANGRNIKLTIEYDGTYFSGWQIQPLVRTVQGEIESALSELTQESIRVSVAGRTDAGVHATGQVANFFTGSVLDIEVFQRGANALLPPDVRIVGAQEVASDFHARFSARWRFYQYHIQQKPHAIGRFYSWTIPYELDMTAMQEASHVLLGEHDFVSFCQAKADVLHHRCFVDRADWLKQDGQFIFSIKANRFVHNMVRILAGTLVDIGRGYRQAQDMESILAARDRTCAGPTAPPQGLFLVQVGYSEKESI